MQEDLNVANSWCITPAGDQKWLIVLTGPVDINVGGNSPGTWWSENHNLHMDWRSPVFWASGRPKPCRHQPFL